MNPVLEQLAHRIAGALFNGVYQGLILAAVLWIGLRFCRGVNAATRHAVSFVALLLVAVLPILHFFWPANLNHNTDNTPKKHADIHEPALHTFDPVQTSSAITPSDIFESLPDDVHAAVVPPPPPAHSSKSFEIIPDVERGESAVNVNTLETLVPSPPVAELPAEPGSTLPTDQIPAPSAFAVSTTSDFNGESNTTSAGPASLLSTFSKPVQTWRTIVPGFVSALIVGVVMLIAGLRLCRLGFQLFALRRLKNESAAPTGDLADLFKNLVCESQISRPVHLLVSEQIATPMAVGYLKPAVLLPAELVSKADQRGIESVLRHELAHVQRNDDWINVAQQVIHATLFFHPAVWWLSRRLTIDREIACDDHALNRLESRHDYALFLTEFAGRSRGHDWIAAPAAWCSSSHLKERINMILDTKRNTSLRLARKSAGLITLATLATAGIALIAGPRLVLAESPDNASSSSASVDLDNDATTTAGSAAMNRNSDQNLFQSSSATVVASGKPVKIHTHSAVTLPNADDALLAPVIVHPNVDAVVHLADVHPRVSVAQNLPPMEPVDALPPKGPKPPSAGHSKPVPMPESAPKAFTLDRATGQPIPSDRYRESLERRIDRLERMIEKLTNERRDIHLEFSPDEWKAKNFAFTDKDKTLWKDNKEQGEALLAAKRELEARQNHWPMSEEQQREIQKSMANAQEEMARAMKDVDMKSREAAIQARVRAKRAQERNSMNEEADSQRKVIELQKQALERQMEDLGRQMERLDRQMEQLDEHLDKLDDQIDENDDETNADDLPEPQHSEPKFKEKN